MLKETFTELLTNYTNNKSLINDFWKEIEVNYSENKRHYHNLSHLENLLKQLIEVKETKLKIGKQFYLLRSIMT